MITRLAREDGWAAVTAIAVLALIIPIGLATLAQADEQTRQAGVERIRESSFSLSEAALNAQAFSLSRNWPGPTSDPLVCTQETPNPTGCPDPASMTFAGTDYGSGETEWRTEVRDNHDDAGAFWSEAGFQNGAHYDASGPPLQDGTTPPDGKMWVKAQATVRERTRTLVALVAREESQIVFPYAVITAGWMETTNSGGKTIVNAGNSEVQVRCPNAPPSKNQSPKCLNYDTSKGDPQVSPSDRYRTNFASTTAIPREALDRLRLTAQSRGTYYATCPSSLPSAELVFIEGTDGANCPYNANNTVNTAAAPGLLVMGRGTLSFGGGHTFNGRIYHANLGNVQYNEQQALVSMGGNSEVIGGITVDGGGGVSIGSSKDNLRYSAGLDQKGITAFNSGGSVQGRWREVPSPCDGEAACP